MYDSCAKWTECFAVSFTYTSFITKLGKVFARFGYAYTLMGDSGPPFALWNFQVIVETTQLNFFSIFYYNLQYNSPVESLLTSFKKMLIIKSISSKNTLFYLQSQSDVFITCTVILVNVFRNTTLGAILKYYYAFYQVTYDTQKRR